MNLPNDPGADNSSAVSSPPTQPAPPSAADPALVADSADRAKIQVGVTSGPRSEGGDRPRGDRPPGDRRKNRRPGGDRPKPAKEILRPEITVQPPSRRAPLPDDLEAEFQSMLGDASMETLMAGSGLAAVAGENLEVDSRHHAAVVRVDVEKDSVFFVIGGRAEGVAAVRQFDTPPEVGAILEVVVTSYNAEDGLYELRVPGASIDVSNWDDIREGSIVDARVSSSNTGGLECTVGGIRGFIPASQVSLYRVENLAEFHEQRLRCVVTEANPRRRNLVLSHRAVLEREREEHRQKLLNELQKGDIREGVIRRVLDFGAFVDLGGVDGLIPVGQLSWERIKHPSDVVQEGQKVRVKVERVDPQTGRISLSYRDLLDHPWLNAEAKFPVESVVHGTVSRIAEFGAFVKLAPGIEGLIHISELAHHRVVKVTNVVKEGDGVDVKILSVDPESQRISLSLKAAKAPPTPAKSEGEAEPDEPRRQPSVPRPKGPLKGGTNRPTGGEGVGLQW